MDLSQSFGDVLKQWVAEIVPYGNVEKFARFTSEADSANGCTRVRATICTQAHTYSIYATPTYLGCGARSRVVRPGEDWLRGNDLPDGQFSRETWDRIVAAMTRYELVALDPILPPNSVPTPAGARDSHQEV